MNIQEYFQKILSLAESLKQNLNSPVDDKSIANVEKQMGLSLPDDLKNLYKIANSQKDFTGLFFFKYSVVNPSGPL